MSIKFIHEKKKIEKFFFQYFFMGKILARTNIQRLGFIYIDRYLREKKNKIFGVDAARRFINVPQY